MRRVLWQWVALGGFVAVCFAAAGIGSWFTYPSVGTWYAGLEKPPWNPPDWVFGPVWTVLYLAMAVAAWLVWRRGGFGGARLALALFGVQLVLNATWSGLFFGLRSPGAGLADIVLLWIAILATILAMRFRSIVAAWLMVPYLAWVSFALVLNFTIWRMNS